MLENVIYSKTRVQVIARLLVRSTDERADQEELDMPYMESHALAVQEPNLPRSRSSGGWKKGQEKEGVDAGVGRVRMGGWGHMAVFLF